MKQVPILMYHWFRAAKVASTSRSPQLEITPELFEQQLAALRSAGYESTSLRAALDGSAPAHSVVLSFDDGTLDFWENARPVLDRHGFKATLFIVSGYVGGESSWDRELGEPARPLMSWEQIAALHEDGYEIGSHTHRHRPLTTISDGEAAEELALSRDTLQRQLGVAPEFLAYPRGFYEERHKRLVREAGYTGACSVILGWGDLRRSNRYELRRMTIKGTESMFRFRLRLQLCGLVRFDEEAA